ncbi:MAG: hypothetical protein Q7K33_02195 [Candidatus Berkelbacteria bacterium]|nr:hypothetical protein [Candidatus Berkelbacteria bacterium]
MIERLRGNLKIVVVITVLLIAGVALLLVRSYQDQSPGAVRDTNETPSNKLPPLISRLPQETNHYRITYNNSKGELLIVPLVDIDGDKNPRNEFARVWPQYEEYANEAVLWMKDQGSNPKDFTTRWWGEEFWPPGKQIIY